LATVLAAASKLHPGVEVGHGPTIVDANDQNIEAGECSSIGEHVGIQRGTPQNAPAESQSRRLLATEQTTTPMEVEEGSSITENIEIQGSTLQNTSFESQSEAAKQSTTPLLPKHPLSSGSHQSNSVNWFRQRRVKKCALCKQADCPGRGNRRLCQNSMEVSKYIYTI
jgi:hypothetical protein